MNIPINSIPPNVVKEATKTRFQISLLLFIGIAYGAFWLGGQSAREQVLQAREASQESKKACAEHVESLKQVYAEQTKLIQRDVAASGDRQMTIANEIVELNSKVGKKK